MGAAFPTTEWSLVVAAGDLSSADARQALETLCARYWYPIYAHARQLGIDADSARDLTQGFFAYVLEKHTLKTASKERGRFRAFLKTALRNYLAHERERAQAQKRGGGTLTLALDFDSAESQYLLEPSHEQSPDDLFEKRWARALMTHALQQLRKTMEVSDDPDRYRLLEPFLTEPPRKDGYDHVAETLELSPAAVRMAVRRLRKLYGDHLRAVIAATVSDPSDIDEELKHLLEVVRS